MKPNGFVPFFG